MSRQWADKLLSSFHVSPVHYAPGRCEQTMAATASTQND